MVLDTPSKTPVSSVLEPLLRLECVVTPVRTGTRPVVDGVEWGGDSSRGSRVSLARRVGRPLGPRRESGMYDSVSEEIGVVDHEGFRQSQVDFHPRDGPDPACIFPNFGRP